MHLLTLSSAASAEFANGTVLDIGMIEGSNAYVQAIKGWQDTSSRWTKPPEVVRSRNVISSCLTMLKTMLQRVWIHLGFQCPPRPQYRTPDSLMPIVDMIQALWRKVNAALPLEHERVRLPIPDFAVTGEWSLSHYVSDIIDTAGLKGLGQESQYRDSLISFIVLETAMTK